MVWVLTVVLVLSLVGFGGLLFLKSRLQGMQFTNEDLLQILEDAKNSLTGDSDQLLDPDDESEGKDLKEIPDDELEDQDFQSVEKAKRVSSIRNYVLFGVDSRKENQFSGLSDVMMIVTIDTKHNSIKLTSLMRDILVPIDGYGKNKLNTVFRFKGPEEAVSTIENITGVQIDGYGIVNFYTVAKIIDILGGVDVKDLSSAEKDDLNKSLREMNKYVSKTSESVSDTGSVHLNGLQAVAYMRIRHVGRGDYQRTDRQRAVVSSLFKGLRDMNLATMLSLVNEITPLVKTDLSSMQILSLAKDVYSLRKSDVKQLRIPLDDAHYLGSYNKMSVIKMDVEANAEAVKQFIYED